MDEINEFLSKIIFAIIIIIGVIYILAAIDVLDNIVLAFSAFLSRTYKADEIVVFGILVALILYILLGNRD